MQVEERGASNESKLKEMGPKQSGSLYTSVNLYFAIYLDEYD